MELSTADLRVPKEIGNKVEGLSANIRFISVKETEGVGYSQDPNAPNDAGHLLFFLKQRFSFTRSRPYERIIFFADCTDRNGRVVCKVLNRKEESMQYFKYTNAGGYGVGSFFVVEEYVLYSIELLLLVLCLFGINRILTPEIFILFLLWLRPAPVCESVKCNGDLPLLRSSSRIYPVSGPLGKLVPRVPLSRPSRRETRYFAIHGHKELTVAGTTLREAICDGEFCDRQRSPESCRSCGCLHNEGGSGMVTQHTLQFSCDTNFSPTGSVMVPNFRSFRFDKLVLQGLGHSVFNDIEPGNNPCNQVLREQVKKLVDHVNSGGGWTIIGWVHGPLTSPDEVIGGEEDIMMHVVLLAPTVAADCDEANEAYKAMSMSHSEFWFRVEEKWPKQDTSNKRQKG